ncbi:MAG: hypothetical protein M1823_003648 [Watsoniomyces obsoletus]|nr:MAG: hypothetical protein M1823_003648 [Watsoniomyces obsoletus]
MHPSTILTLFGFLAGGVLADNIYTFETTLQQSAQLLKRQQSAAFVPTGRSGKGRDCEDAFGPGKLECGNSRKCFNPTRKESCCYGKYTCPTGSFCLTEGKCCPDGIDPVTCAMEQGVMLPIDFDQDAATRSAPSAPTTTPVGVHEGGNGTFPQPTATTTGARGTGSLRPTSSASSTGSAPIFSGAAQSNHGQVGGLAAMAVAFLGVLGNLI